MLCWWKKIGYSEYRSYFFTAGCRLFFWDHGDFVALVFSLHVFNVWFLLNKKWLIPTVNCCFYSVMELGFMNWKCLALTSLKSHETFKAKPIITKLYLSHQHKQLISGAVMLLILVYQLVIHVFFLLYVGETCSF